MNNNPKIETDLTEILKQINTKLDKISEDIVELKIAQTTTNGKIETLDSKVENLDKRVGSIEFANRGIFISLLLLVLGGAIKLSGIVS